MEKPRKYRTTIKIQEDSERVEGLLVQGYGVRAIAKELDLSEDQVYHHKREIEQEWGAVRSQNREKILGRLVSNQMALQRAAWRGWQNSLEDEITETDERNTVFSDGTPQEQNKSKVVTKGQAGNPSFLAQIIKSDSMIARWMGLEENDTTGGGLSAGFTAELRSQLGISADDFQILRKQRLQRQKEKALALEAQAEPVKE